MGARPAGARTCARSIRRARGASCVTERYRIASKAELRRRGKGILGLKSPPSAQHSRFTSLLCQRILYLNHRADGWVVLGVDASVVVEIRSVPRPGVEAGEIADQILRAAWQSAPEVS